MNELFFLTYLIVCLFFLPLHSKDRVTRHTPIHSPFNVAFLLFLSILLLIEIQTSYHTKRNEIYKEMEHCLSERFPSPLREKVCQSTQFVVVTPVETKSKGNDCHKGIVLPF